MELSERFNEALLFAVRLHAGQTRKLSGEPYVSHLLRVCGTALAYGADEDEAIAALLHDAIEDQGGATTRERIRQRFGDRVAEIVHGCTDTDQTPKPPWRERKQQYLNRLRTASRSVRLVSAADKLDNARSAISAYRQHGASIWAQFRGGQEGKLWYFRSVVDILKGGEPHGLIVELEEAVATLERLVASQPASTAKG